MRGYTILSLLLLAIVSFLLLRIDDSELLAFEDYVRKMGVSAYERLRDFDEKIQPPYYNALTWVDFEDNFYLDKETVDQIMARGFYAREQKVKPGVYYIVITGYSSTVSQCGPNPFVTASGQKVRDGIVATNFLPFGTRLKIPDVFGDKVFVVQDRMAQRYWGRIDVWFPNYNQASRFGSRRLKVEVL